MNIREEIENLNEDEYDLALTIQHELKFPQIDGHGLIGLTQPDTDHAKENKELHAGVPRRSR